MRIAVCQIRASDDPGKNAISVKGCLSEKADMYVFPEMFLTGYTFPGNDKTNLTSILEELRTIAAERDVCIVVGGPEVSDDGMYNSAYVITDRIQTYRKVHLPSFPPFSEKERFVPGKDTFTFDFKGIRFGLCICYDIFFPEQLKACTMDGSTVNIVISASPVTSRTAFERVFTARALENTSYLVFCNNIGGIGGTEFFGGSRALSPDGSLLKESYEEGTVVFDYDPDAVETARRNRPVIGDTVPLRTTVFGNSLE